MAAAVVVACRWLCFQLLFVVGFVVEECCKPNISAVADGNAAVHFLLQMLVQSVWFCVG